LTATVHPPFGGPLTGDYHGRPTHRLESAHLWLEALATAGPRIVRLGLAGSPINLLAETPEVSWETPLGRYELLGGHRLWFAPEDPDLVAVPDSHGLELQVEGDRIRLIGPDEPSTGLRRSIAVRLDPDHPAVEIDDELRNVGDQPLQLAPWSITQLPPGGRLRLPQPLAITEHIVHPNRILVLWPYTSWDDARLELREGELVIHSAPGPWFKVGSFIDAGWLAYDRDDVSFVCRFKPQPGKTYPDLGCNVEIYCGDAFLELEVLGPLATLAPGEVVTLSQRWELSATTAGDGA
jgi:Domain of unknown function (DUF4380)